MSETGFDETPGVTSRLLHKLAIESLINIVSGGCGTSPKHIAAIAHAVQLLTARGLNAGVLHREAA